MRASDRSAYMDELDRLVDAELQTLITHLKRRMAHPPGPSDPPDRAQAAESARPSSNVVRAHPLARRPRPSRPSPMEALFAPDEAAFLANAADWLRGRPNVDILLDALTRSVLAEGEDDAGGQQDGTAAGTEAAAPDGTPRGGGDIEASPDDKVDIDPADFGDDPPEADRPAP